MTARRNANGPESSSLPPDLAEAEGAWTERDVEEWEQAREEAWATWRTSRCDTDVLIDFLRSSGPGHDR